MKLTEMNGKSQFPQLLTTEELANLLDLKILTLQN